MAGVAREPKARGTSPRPITALPQADGERDPTPFDLSVISKGRPSRPLPRPPPSARLTRRSSSSSGPGSRKRKSDVREPHPGRVSGLAAAGLRQLRRALLSGPQPAGRSGDELASRGHRRQADRGAGRQDPAADHQPATPSSEILDGLDRVSGLVSGA